MKELMKAQREAARKKAQMQESVADVYDTNIRTFSKSITEGKHGSKSWKQLGVGSSTELCKSESGQWRIRDIKWTLGSLPGRELLDKHAGFFAERYE